MIGETISHYKILEELGAGGMGVVYKAEDTKLKRTVALKFLSPQSLGSKKEQSRFIHEAQAAAALDHSNICTIHEINEVEGKSFIAMAYVDGPSLREEVESGPLDVDRAVNIAIQVADGLRVAHNKGIVHRDIKSANIMLTSEGQAKITDFGLAKLPGRTKLTKTGTTVGTLAYMSPEQAQGAEVDHRTDIWSLGVVLYELLTGSIPFKADHEAAMVYSIMNQDVKPPSDLTPGVPAELDSIVAKMLQKNTDDRYASTEELLSDLRKVQAGAAVKVALPMSRKAKRVMWGLSAMLVIVAAVTSLIILNRGPSTVVARTLAVVDFDIIGGEDAPYLAEGLAEGISAKLSKLQSVRVASSDDIRRLRRKDISAREVASQLDAQFALGGSLLRTGEQIRVTPQLIEASTGDVIWSEPFDREFSNVLDFLDEVSLKIVEVLKIELSPAEKVTLEEKPTESAEAYEHYLKGRHFYYRLTFQDNELSTKEFQRALQIDADYPLALAGLADAYVQRYRERYDYDEYWLDEADSLIDRALELDPDLAEAYESRAEVLFEKENYLGALEAAERARSLQPDLDEPYVRLGEIYQQRGERRKSLEMYQQALSIRPSVAALCGSGAVFQARLTHGDLDSAEAAYRVALELNPDHDRPYRLLANLFVELDSLQQAEKMYRRAIEVRPDHASNYRGLMEYLERQDRNREVLELLRGFVQEHPYTWGAYETLFEWLVYYVGDYPGAIEVVEAAVARNPDRVWPHLLLAHATSDEVPPEKVVESVERALELRPNSSRVLASAGNVYAGMGETGQAFEYYERALKVNPGSARVLASMTGLLFKEGRYDSAAVMAAKAIEQSPGIISPPWDNNYMRLGKAMTHLQRTDEYIDVLENAADNYGQDNPVFFQALGDEQCLAGRFQDAISSYRHRLDVRKDTAPLMRIGMVQWLQGDAEAALSTFNEAFAADSQHPYWRCEHRIITLLKYLKRFDEIDQRYDRIREEEGPSAGFFTRDYYISMRRYDDALAALTELSDTSVGIWENDALLGMIGVYRQKGDLSKAREILEDHEASLPAWWEAWANLERAALAAIEGDMSSAVDFAEKAFEGYAGSRVNDFVVAFLARLQYAAGQTEQALATLERVQGHDDAWLVLPLYRKVQLEMVSGSGRGEGSLEKAHFFSTRAARKIMSTSNDLGDARCYRALTSARRGDSEATRNDIEYARHLEPERADVAYHAACAYALIGDTTLALQWLKKSVERGHQELWWARVDPDLDSLRDLPRFQGIMDDWDRRLSAMID